MVNLEYRNKKSKLVFSFYRRTDIRTAITTLAPPEDSEELREVIGAVVVGPAEVPEVVGAVKEEVIGKSDVTDVEQSATRHQSVLPSWVRDSSLKDSLIDLVGNPSSDEDFMINKLAQSQQSILNQGYYCDFKGIHSPFAVEFYKNFLKASPEVIDILVNGYYPRFISEPPAQFFKDNNRSAKDNMDFVRLEYLNKSFYCMAQFFKFKFK